MPETESETDTMLALDPVVLRVSNRAKKTPYALGKHTDRCSLGAVYFRTKHFEEDVFG